MADQFDHAYSRPANSSFWDLDISDPGYAHLFDGPIYYRGAMALYALRLEIGKADFDKVLRRWATKYENGNATTADFRQLSEHISGKSLDALFDEWLLQSGKPADPR
jgi:aminopeptidase N